MTRRRRQLLAGLTAAVLVTVAGIVGIHISGDRGEANEAVGEGEMPTALARHLEQLRGIR